MRAWKRLLALLAGVALVMASAAGATPATAAVNWQADATRPQFYNLNAVTYGNGQFVAVGNHGAIIASPDGAHWQVRQGGGEANILSVAYGNGHYVATPGPWPGDGSQAAGPSVLLSADGVTWSRQPVPDSYAGVTFCDGEFWATVQYPAGLAHSKDGATWQTERLNRDDPAESIPLNRIACGGGSVVAVTAGNDALPMAVVTYRPGDDVRWTRQILAGVTEMYDVAYGDGRFVITGYGGGTSSTSADGKTWTCGTEQHGFLTNVAYGDGHWTGVSFAGASTSTDGLAWRDQFGLVLGGLGIGGGLAYGDGRFVAVGLRGYTALSTDGLTWQAPPGASGYGEANLVFSNGRFVTLGVAGDEQGRSYVETSFSEDGLTWESQLLARAGNPLQLFYDYRGQQFVAILSDGTHGSLYTSADARTWKGPVPLPDRILAVAGDGGQYLAIAVSSDDLGESTGPSVPAMLYRSPDLVKWEGTPAPAGTPRTLSYGNGTYVLTEEERTGEPWHIAGYPVRNFLYTSPDGRTWSRQDAPIARAVYCGGRFADPLGRSSSDGITWTDYVPGSGAGGYALT